MNVCRVCAFWMCVCYHVRIKLLLPASPCPAEGPLNVHLFLFFSPSVIYELIPLTQSHFLFLHHHINKFIALAQRYMCFFWFRSHLSLAYLKATQPHTLPAELWVLALCHCGFRVLLLHLKAPR